MQTYKELMQEFMEHEKLGTHLADSLNYAIFFIGASTDDNFSSDEIRDNLFKLRHLVKFLNKLEKNYYNGNM
jgi:hypothetical protein